MELSVDDREDQAGGERQQHEPQRAPIAQCHPRCYDRSGDVRRGEGGAPRIPPIQQPGGEARRRDFGRRIVRAVEGIARSCDREEEEGDVAEVERRHDGEDRVPRRVAPAYHPERKRSGVQNRVVREVARVDHPREDQIGRLPNPAIGDLRAEDPRLEPLDEKIVLKAGAQREDADLTVQGGEQQHRIPVAQEPADGAGVAGARGQQHERQNQRVRRQDPRPAGNSIAAEREQNGAGRHRDIGTGRKVDGGVAPP